MSHDEDPDIIERSVEKDAHLAEGVEAVMRMLRDHISSGEIDELMAVPPVARRGLVEV